jgi:hypothetical protein
VDDSTLVSIKMNTAWQVQVAGSTVLTVIGCGGYGFGDIGKGRRSFGFSFQIWDWYCDSQVGM